MFKKNIALLIFSLSLATLGVAQQSAATKTWTQPFALSTGGEGWESTVAIDAAGNTVAVWDQRSTKGFVTDRVWGRTRAATGTWSATTVVSRMNPPLATTYVFPAVRVSASGNATAIWGDVDGSWTADRSATGIWTPSQLLIPAISGPAFVMNSKGDAALMWSTGSVRGSSTSIIVMRRPAGSIWGAQETVATGAYVGRNSIGISNNGDVMVAWETYSASCGIEKCTLSNFVLHASRELAAASAWQDSGPLTAVDPASHSALTTLDRAGRAVLVYSMPGAYNAITQLAAGSAWSAPALVYASTSMYTAGLSSDASGNATLALLDLTLGTGQVMTVNGNISNNIWSPAVKVSGGDIYPNQVIYGGSTSGAAVLTWAAGDPNYSNYKIRGAVRLSSAGSWTSPKTLSPANAQLAAPEAVAVNTKGNAAVILSSFDNFFSGHTEYAVNFQ